MYKRLIIVILFAGICLSSYVLAQNTGQIPVPVFTDVKVQAIANFDSVTGLYTYNYTISNPATNTGEIWNIDIDITTTSTDSVYLSSAGLTIPVDGTTPYPFDGEVARFSARNRNKLVPIGIRVPSGWSGHVREREVGGIAGFASTDTPNILPGQTQSGFEFISPGLPTIRQIEIEPWWIMVEEGPASEEGADIARSIEESLIFRTKTIGPTAPPYYSSPNTFLDMIWGYINESVTLGWLIDPALKNTLQTELNTARSYLRPEVNDPTSAKAALRRFMTAINLASSTQRTTEAQGLLYYNTDYLVRQLPDTPLQN